MPERQDPIEPIDLPVPSPGPLFSVLAAQEIPRPKDWQDFQRGCVVLFQAELKDPHAQEYGRHGQKQPGSTSSAAATGFTTTSSGSSAADTTYH
jgi:cellulose synthase operon protein C